MDEWKTMGWMVKHAVGSLLLAAIALTGCVTPVGVRRMDSHEVHRKLTESVLAGEKLSAPTMQILNRSGLAQTFRDKPAEVIETLHKGIPTNSEPDRLFALAERSFLHAGHSKDSSTGPRNR
jgi:hypothetical protein